MLTFIAICLIVLAVLNSLFGALVFMGSRRSRQAFLFMVFDSAVALWSLGIGLLYLTTSETAAFWYVRLYYAAAALIAYSLLLFVIDYSGRIVSKTALSLISLPFMLVLFTILHPSGLIGDILLQPIPPVVKLNQPAYLAYALYFIVYFVASVVTVWRGRVSAVKNNRKDKVGFLYILVAIVSSGVFGMIFNLILPLLGNYDLIWIGPMGSLWMVSLIFVAVIRHSLFDIKLAMFLILGYFMLALGLMGVTAAVLFVANGLIGGVWTVDGRDYVLTVAVTGFAIVSYQPLRRIVDRVAERIFFKQVYDTQTVLRQFNTIIVAETDLRKLLQKTRSLLLGALQPVDLSIVTLDQRMRVVTGVGVISDVNATQHTAYLKNDRQEPVLLKRGNEQEELFVPLTAASQIVGYMVFGPKRSGELYRSKDLHLIQLVTTELSIAVQNGLRYEEIEEFNDTLKQRIEEATAELKNTNRRLKLLDQTKDEFISLTSHQLRTPLTTIKGYISMLLDGDAGDMTPQQRKLLEEAFNSSQRMVHLISDFLNISRIQTGKFEIELSEVNLADILDEEIEQLRISATSRQLVLDYAKPEHFPVLTVDEGKIRQVMMNFIDNAIYYSLGGTTIRIILSSTANAVEFKVIDQGIGVPKAEQHKLFTKFSRASNAKKQRPDGTGIGLFMAKKVIVALGGAIIFESKEGVGSTFGFRLNRTATASKLPR